jgi:hypothetical protein
VNPNTGYVEIKSVGVTDIAPEGQRYSRIAHTIDEHRRGDFPVDVFPDAIRQLIVGNRAVYIIMTGGTLWTISDQDRMGLGCRDSWYGNDCLMPAKYPCMPVVHAFLGDEQALIVCNNPVDSPSTGDGKNGKDAMAITSGITYHAVGSTRCMPGSSTLIGKSKPPVLFPEAKLPFPLKMHPELNGFKTMCINYGYTFGWNSYRRHAMVHVVDEEECVWQCGEFGTPRRLLSVDNKGCILQYDETGEAEMLLSKESRISLCSCDHTVFAIFSPRKALCE